MRCTNQDEQMLAPVRVDEGHYDIQKMFAVLKMHPTCILSWSFAMVTDASGLMKSTLIRLNQPHLMESRTVALYRLMNFAYRWSTFTPGFRALDTEY